MNTTQTILIDEVSMIPADRMNTIQMETNPFREVAHTETTFKLYGKKGATWEQMNSYLERVWGKNGEDKHWKWRGFGECGTEDFVVVMMRQHCNEYICDCEPCEECGIEECQLEENDNGDKVCYECMNKCDDESDDDEDSPNIYPYKECSKCGNRCSCGGYDTHKKWLCEGCFPAEIFIFTKTDTVKFPDGTTKKLESTECDGDCSDEMYAEHNDIGVFFYKNNSHSSWMQGQPPTYPNSPTLDTDDGFILQTVV